MLRLGRINVRLLMLVAAVALPICWYGYALADQLIYHGIKPHDGWTEVDLKTVGFFPFHPETDGINQVPVRFRALDGKRIMLQGVMYSADSAASSVGEFQFVYNVQVCCFSGLPQVQERVFARCAPGKHVTYYYNQPVRLMGILHVNVERDAWGVATAVYRLDVESVDPL